MRRGSVIISPQVLPLGPVTRADFNELGAPVAQIDLESVGDEETAEVPFAKMISGLLTAADLIHQIKLELDGQFVMLQTSDFVQDKQRFYDGVGAGAQPTLSSATAVFTTADVGQPIESNYLPAGTTVLSRQSATQITCSNDLLGTAAGGIFRLTARPIGTGTRISGTVTEINVGSIFRGRIETEGLNVLPGGTVIIGKGPTKMTALTNGTFIWGNEDSGAAIGIYFDGRFFAGGLNPSLTPVAITAAGDLFVRNTATSVHAINIGAIDVTMSTPIILPTGGHFDTTLAIAIICLTAGAKIYYTTDGSTPDDTKPLYTGPFNITVTTTVKAIAYKLGEKSGVRTQTFTEDGGLTVSNPVCDPVGATYTPVGGVLTVELRCITPGSSIRYTLDGTTPSTTVGTLISPANGSTPPLGNFTLNANTIVKAIAYKTGLTSSGVITETYAISAGGGGGGGPSGGGRGNYPH